MELIEHQAHKIKEQDKTIETLQRRVFELETLAGILPGNYERVPVGYLCVGKNVVGADE